MPPDIAPPFTWPDLLNHLQTLWGRPPAQFMPELLPYFRHEIIANLEPVLVGSKVLTGLYQPPPAATTWLKTCIEAADEWVWACRRASDDCLAENTDLAQQCQCFLQKIDPVFANCADLLAASPNNVLDSLDPDAAQILNTVTTSLSRLVDMSAGLHTGDLTWLKIIFDDIQRKKQGKG